MEKNRIVIKGSFRGISADLTRNFMILIINFIIYLTCDSYKDKLITKNNIDSLLEFVLNSDQLEVVAILATVYVVILIVLLITLSTIIKIIRLFYNLARVTIFDFTSEKVIAHSYSFPFNKTTDENKFSEVINVNIEQGLLGRLFNAGNMYVEYIAVNTVDSQLRNVEIPNAAKPFLQKNKIM